MRGIAFYFFCTGILSVLIGMLWGIQMSATHDHRFAPAHAHLNLLGWVTMSIFAFYYHLVPAAAEGLLPKVHFTAALAGLVLLTPGIVMAVAERGEGLAKAGSLLTLASMGMFLAVVLRQGARGAQPA